MRMASPPLATRAVTTDALMSADLPGRRGSRRSERMGITTASTKAPQAHFPISENYAPWKKNVVTRHKKRSRN